MLMSILNLCSEIFFKLKTTAVILLLSVFFAAVNCAPHFSGDSGIILHKNGFYIAYTPEFRQAGCTCYTLTAQQVKGKKVKRTNKFKTDYAVADPVRPEEYTATGFDRGHLVPASDMSYSKSSMHDSFYMTNISPQHPACNRGIWKKLETQVRKWAVKEKKIIVLTGPVIPKDAKEMKDTRIAVPVAFFKVIYDVTPPKKMIGFIIPNQGRSESLKEFAVPVKTIEKITGYDFFCAPEFKDVNELELQQGSGDWTFDSDKSSARKRSSGKKRKAGSKKR